MLEHTEGSWYNKYLSECLKTKELQKENAELKKTYRKQRNKRIDELQKENAELKKKNLDARDAVTMQMYTNKANKEIADKQLTKAKEIIRELLGSCFGYNSKTVNYEVRAKAEQFLSEE